MLTWKGSAYVPSFTRFICLKFTLFLCIVKPRGNDRQPRVAHRDLCQFEHFFHLKLTDQGLTTAVRWGTIVYLSWLVYRFSVASRDGWCRCLVMLTAWISPGSTNDAAGCRGRGHCDPNGGPGCASGDRGWKGIKTRMKLTFNGWTIASAVFVWIIWRTICKDRGMCFPS